MLLLPRGDPAYENISAATVDPPGVLSKLREMALTGYVRFTFAASSVVLLFDRGRLISCMQERGDKRLFGLDALSAAFEAVVAEGGRLDVYHLAGNLVGSIHALLQGELLYSGQELRLIDARGLLARMKAERLNGCLRIYTAERNALIFYRDGVAVGFFHDGSQSIETSAKKSQRIAGLPGAKLDVLRVRDPDALSAFDLLEMVNVQKVWEMIVARHRARMNRISSETEQRAAQERKAWLKDMEGDLKEVAEAYLGRAGRSVIDKALASRGGIEVLLDVARLNLLWTDVQEAAKLLAGHTKTDEMLSVMRNEVDERLQRRQQVDS